jgi:hypothetical protein
VTDFTLVATTRPVQTIKKVIAGEAECALIDDAQFAELGKIEGGAALKSVWKSDKLPPMVVVAFPSAPAAERSAFKGSLGQICGGDGKAACGEVGIKDLSAAGNKPTTRPSSPPTASERPQGRGGARRRSDRGWRCARRPLRI